MCLIPVVWVDWLVFKHVCVVPQRGFSTASGLGTCFPQSPQASCGSTSRPGSLLLLQATSRTALWTLNIHFVFKGNPPYFLWSLCWVWDCAGYLLCPGWVSLHPPKGIELLWGSWRASAVQIAGLLLSRTVFIQIVQTLQSFPPLIVVLWKARLCSFQLFYSVGSFIFQMYLKLNPFYFCHFVVVFTLHFNALVLLKGNKLCPKCI